MAINATGVTFKILDQSIEVPLQGLHVTMGGASNRLVFLSTHWLMAGAFTLATAAFYTTLICMVSLWCRRY